MQWAADENGLIEIQIFSHSKEDDLRVSVMDRMVTQMEMMVVYETGRCSDSILLPPTN